MQQRDFNGIKIPIFVSLQSMGIQFLSTLHRDETHLDGYFLTPGVGIKQPHIIHLPMNFPRQGQCEGTTLHWSPNRPIVDIQVQIYNHTMNMIHHMFRYENVPT